jgi:hypothetical protein
MSRSKVSMFAVLLIAAQVAIAHRASSQDPSQQVQPGVPVPPHYSVYSCCYNVLCEGANFYVPVKSQSAVSQEDACAQAMNQATQLCPGGIGDMYQLTPRACKLLSISDAIALRSAAPSDSNNWQVVATLCYCDGTPGVRATIAGANRCDALSNAREFLCEVKMQTHPCKRAFMKFCVVKRPCPTAACPICK